MSHFVVRLWVHFAEDGLLPEITVQADTQMHAAALALDHFIAIHRSVAPDSYLQCEPCDSRYLRVRDVVEWLQTAEGRRFQHRPWRDHVLITRPIARARYFRWRKRRRFAKPAPLMSSSAWAQNVTAGGPSIPRSRGAAPRVQL